MQTQVFVSYFALVFLMLFGRWEETSILTIKTSVPVTFFLTFWTQTAKIWSLIATLEELVETVKCMSCFLETGGLRRPGSHPCTSHGPPAPRQCLVSHFTTQVQLHAGFSSRLASTYTLPAQNPCPSSLDPRSCLYMLLFGTHVEMDGCGSGDSCSCRYPLVWRGSPSTPCCILLFNFWVQVRGRGDFMKTLKGLQAFLLLFSLRLIFFILIRTTTVIYIILKT